MNERHGSPEQPGSETGVQESKMSFEHALTVDEDHALTDAELEIGLIRPTLQDGESFPGSKAFMVLLHAEALNSRVPDEKWQDLALKFGELKEAYVAADDKQKFVANLQADLRSRINAIRNPVIPEKLPDYSL